MNKNQKIVLIIGAIALLIVIFTAPKIVIRKGHYLRAEDMKTTSLAPMVDIRTALIRALGVVGATLLLFYALKNSKKENEESGVKKSGGQSPQSDEEVAQPPIQASGNKTHDIRQVQKNPQNISNWILPGCFMGVGYGVATAIVKSVSFATPTGAFIGTTLIYGVFGYLGWFIGKKAIKRINGMNNSKKDKLKWAWGAGIAGFIVFLMVVGLIPSKNQTQTQTSSLGLGTKRPSLRDVWKPEEGGRPLVPTPDLGLGTKRRSFAEVYEEERKKVTRPEVDPWEKRQPPIASTSLSPKAGESFEPLRERIDLTKPKLLLKVLSARYEYGHFKVQGIIENTGNQDALDPEIGLDFVDESGSLLGKGSIRPFGGNLPPGKITSFEINKEVSGNPTKYRIYVKGFPHEVSLLYKP